MPVAQTVSLDNNTEKLGRSRLGREKLLLAGNNSLLALIRFLYCETHAKPNAELCYNPEKLYTLIITFILQSEKSISYNFIIENVTWEAIS